MATRCRDAWSECPKGRLVRRYARQSGSKIEFKLAADVLVLVRYWKSGEKCEQLTDIFVKVTELNARVKESNVSRERCHLATDDGLALFKELSISMDNLESKLFTVIEERSASMSEMRIDIEELKLALEIRDNRIQSLQAVFAGLKELLRVNYDQEQIRHGKNVNESLVAKATGNETASTTESAIKETTAFDGAVHANVNLSTRMRASKEGASKESEKSPDIIYVDDNIISSSSNGSQSNQISPTPKHLVPCPFLRRRGHCLKGSNCDFLHNSQQQRLRYTQPFFHQAQIQPILDPNSYQMLQHYPHPFYQRPFPRPGFFHQRPYLQRGLYPPPLMQIPTVPPIHLH